MGGCIRERGGWVYKEVGVYVRGAGGCIRERGGWVYKRVVYT